MKQIFVNLKRFDVPRAMGGLCPVDDPKLWIEQVIADCAQRELGSLEDISLVFLLPESLILIAHETLTAKKNGIHIGCQGVFREDVTVGGNFGAFTSNRPATAMRAIGCTWSIIGHSEERKDKLGILAAYDPTILKGGDLGRKARAVVNQLIREEVACALKAGLKALVCVGETAEERGSGSFKEQKPRIETVLREQVEASLPAQEDLALDGNIVIGYEPIWAIGPGKTPPGAEYITFVSNLIRQCVQESFGFTPAVVYGGGLKEENAQMIASVELLSGGLVALTRFSGEIGFYPEELERILLRYVGK